MTKEQKIQEAYGEQWDVVKESVNMNDGYCDNELFQDDDGKIIKCPGCGHIFHESKTVYCINSLERCPQCNDHVSQHEYHYKFINVPEDAQKIFGKWRPKSLSGIETNNGWTKIESEEDLPKEHSICWFKRKGGGGLMCREFFAKSDEKYVLLKFSHYQIIEKPEPPIY